MAPSSVHFDEAQARESDALQATYFRGVLVDRRALVSATLAHQARRLNQLSTRPDSLGLRRLRREIRSNDSERRELDRMIEALDGRFSTISADQR